jgi:hypothetical protein
LAFLVYPYVALYAVVAIWTIRAGARAGAPAWKSATTTVVDALGVAGMLVWARGDPAPWLVVGWRIVLPVLAAGTALRLVWWYRRAFAREWRASERREPQLRALLVTSATFATLAFLPMLWINARLAYSAA